jgi:hypothetical protein
MTSENADSQRLLGKSATSGVVGVRSNRGVGGSSLRGLAGGGGDATEATTGADFGLTTRKPCAASWP